MDGICARGSVRLRTRARVLLTSTTTLARHCRCGCAVELVSPIPNVLIALQNREWNASSRALRNDQHATETDFPGLLSLWATIARFVCSAELHVNTIRDGVWCRGGPTATERTEATTATEQPAQRRYMHSNGRCTTSAGGQQRHRRQPCRRSGCRVRLGPGAARAGLVRPLPDSHFRPAAGAGRVVLHVRDDIPVHDGPSGLSVRNLSQDMCY